MTAKFFGQFLLERGKVNREQLIVAVELQKVVNVKLGTLAIDRGYMTFEQVERINGLQKKVDRKFGELAVSEGVLTDAQVKELLEQQKQDRLMLGEALVQKGFLTLQQLQGELAAFKKDQEGIPSSVTEIYKNVQDAAAFEVFADVTTKMFTRIADETVKIEPLRQPDKPAHDLDFAIEQRFRGGFKGRFVLCVSGDLLARIASRMLKEEVSQKDEIAQDGAAEFVNIVSGNVCARLSLMGRPTDILPPRVHDWRKTRPKSATGFAAGAEVVVTPMLHPGSRVEFWIVKD